MIEWKDEYSVGVEAIDKDHKTLITLVNRYLTESERKPAVLVHRLFRDLENYTNYHFHREEGLMAKCGYDGLEEHKRRHEEIRATLKAFSDKVTHKFSAEDQAELRAFLSSWLLDHVLKEDFKYRDAMTKLDSA